MKNVKVLEATLNHEKRWYKVGEQIFSNDVDGLKSLKSIKNAIGMIQTMAFFDVFWQTSQSTVTWGEFKRIGLEHIHIDSLKNLPFEDTKIVSQMMTVEKEDIAGKLALADGWEYFIDYYVKDFERNREVKTAIISSYQEQSKKTATRKLTDLISQIYPRYTMKQFFTTCKKCHFNDTLEDLQNISSKHISAYNSV